jgi:rare lipoprotein A (peptidoglycan hydrolase)
MSDVRRHLSAAPSPVTRLFRFPRFATFAAAGYLMLATVDLATEPPVAVRQGPVAQFGGATVQGAVEQLQVGERHEASVSQSASLVQSGAGMVSSPEDIAAAEPRRASTTSSPTQRTLASWYGRGFQGRPTASGEPFDMHGYTAAHRTLPFGTPVEVRNPRNGRAVVVRINDRGPHSRRREIDLSYAAAAELGIARRGTARVELRVLR